MLIAVKNKFIVLFIIILGTLSFPEVELVKFHIFLHPAIVISLKKNTNPCLEPSFSANPSHRNIPFLLQH